MHGLEIPVVVPLAVVQLEVVELIRDGPDAAHRVGELAGSVRSPILLHQRIR